MLPEAVAPHSRERRGLPAPSPFHKLGKSEDVRFRELVEEHFQMFKILLELKCNGFVMTNDLSLRSIRVLDQIMRSQKGMNGGDPYRAPLIKLPGPG